MLDYSFTLGRGFKPRQVHTRRLYIDPNVRCAFGSNVASVRPRKTVRFAIARLYCDMGANLLVQGVWRSNVGKCMHALLLRMRA